MEVKYISVIKDICELGSHVKKMDEALENGLIYCPSKRGAKHDGCFFDPSLGQITKTFQFKMKEEGSNLHPVKLENWIKEYANLDELNIGFYRTEDYERFRDVIIQRNQIQLVTDQKLQVVADDYSSFVTLTGDIDVDKILYLIYLQTKLVKTITYVNESLIDSFGNIL